MEFLFINHTRISIPKKRWSALAKKCVTHVRPLEHANLKRVPNMYACIVMVGRRRSKKLNHTYRGKNCPTDVLSFQGIEPRHLGDVVLCKDVLKAQGKKWGQSFSFRGADCIVHGLLHLLGYDHQDPQDEKTMLSLQSQLLQKYF